MLSFMLPDECGVAYHGGAVGKDGCGEGACAGDVDVGERGV